MEDKQFEVSYEYEPTPDSEERLNKIFEFLLSNPDKKIQEKCFIEIEGCVEYHKITR